VNAVSDAPPKGTIVISLAPNDRLPPSAVLALESMSAIRPVPVGNVAVTPGPPSDSS